jgi:hypothetical protein
MATATMSEKPLRVEKVGIVWYKPEQYGAIRAYMEDGMKLPLTYEKWLAAAEQGLAQLGDSAVKAELDVAIFKQWCKERRLRPNAKARLEWANRAALEAWKREGGIL